MPTEVNSTEKIMDMLAKGQISSEEAQLLLANLASPPKSRSKFLWSPFESLSTKQAIAGGIVALLASVALSYLGIRFDGVLDLHYAATTASFSQILAESILNWPFLAAALWLGSKFFCRDSRFIDMFAFVGFSRIPVVTAAILAYITYLGVNPEDLLTLPLWRHLLFVTASLPCMILYIRWLYSAYIEAGGIRSRAGKWSFVGFVLATEVIAKMVLAGIG